jgi:NAD(P)-dependent dehydrogenase (short-subunit alcohol dehydrogenase family)
MDLHNRTVLILGGSGLVGHAVARRLLDLHPTRIVLVALFEQDVTDTARALDPVRGNTVIDTAWGNVFLPVPAAQMDRAAALGDPDMRKLMLDDLLGDLTDEVLERSFLYQLLARYEPDAVVDCINTATAFAYQDIFHSARDLRDAADSDQLTREQVEQHVLTLTMPQLIRHTQIASEAMRLFKTQAYVKIGTSGTGGMGLNIPYTHSEERPSRTLLTKSAIAGAHSLLLFLMGRTPDAPATVEIKPTATIAWREIGFGPIRRKGSYIQRFDCPDPLQIDQAFSAGASGWKDMGEVVESVYIDSGENGFFARDEFETVTSLGSMEFITPEEVAEYVVLELAGHPTGRDVIAALDAATAGPTYRAGILRAHAVERLKALESKHGVRAVAFELLGPPRLTKNLYEAHILSRLRPSVRGLAESSPQQIADEASHLLSEDAALRSLILSVGLPIVLDDAKVYRGETVIVPPTDGDIEAAIPRGWVDLRASRMADWIARGARIVAQDEARTAQAEGSGSGEDWVQQRPEDPIEPSRMAAWMFKYEDKGERIKR